MTGFRLDERAWLSIELALTAGRRDPLLFSQQDAKAGRLGMTGAEIDMARRGASFQFQTSRAIALALAQSGEDRTAGRERAVKAGIDERTCSGIERFAADIATSSPAGGRRHGT